MPVELPDSAALQAELDGLMYAISHDLRAPARAITGFAQVLREQLEAHCSNAMQGDTLRFLERIEASSQRLHQMLDGLLMLSRLSQQPLRGQPVPLKSFCQTIIELQPPAPQACIQLEMSDTLQVEADPKLLGIAFNALLDNARKFSSRSVQPVIRIEGQVHNAATILCISDNGAGFDMQYASRLGVPFQHLHADPELTGMGLGLACVRRVMARHGGTLRAEGQLGHGSHFYLEWPCAGLPATTPIDKT